MSIIDTKRHPGRRVASTHLASFLVMVVFMLISASADCECGYEASTGRGDGDGGKVRLFTDILETDFENVQNISANTDWARQGFNLTRDRARGQFGEMFAAENVYSNPSQDRGRTGRGGVGINGGTAGLGLVVKSQPVGDMVPVAELASSRLDILWGTFRVGMKLTGTSGTCSAFFWYYNDTQEIDMEFLSKDFNPANGSFPVNLVLQSRAAAEAGFNAQATGYFKKAYLPFDPTLGFHEYRVDFLPGRVIFYADGDILAEMTGAAVPTHQGHLILAHWSNGNPLWSGGPPQTDAVMTVSYVKAYFNSSAQARQGDWARRCRDQRAPGAVCRIPDFSRDSVRSPYFFSIVGNMTNNQTISNNPELKSEARGARGARRGSYDDPQWLATLGLPFLASAWVIGMWL